MCQIEHAANRKFSSSFPKANALMQLEPNVEYFQTQIALFEFWSHIL